MDEVKDTLEQTGEPAPKPGTGEGDRLFTQAEVNEIIKTRLARSKTGPREPTEAEKREQAITARESRMECREYLADKGYPRELLEIIDTSDPVSFRKKADNAYSVFGSHPRRVAPLKSYEPEITGDTSFGSTKHKPRQYPPFSSDR